MVETVAQWIEYKWSREAVTNIDTGGIMRSWAVGMQCEGPVEILVSVMQRQNRRVVVTDEERGHCTYHMTVPGEVCRSIK